MRKIIAGIIVVAFALTSANAAEAGNAARKEARARKRAGTPTQRSQFQAPGERVAALRRAIEYLGKTQGERYPKSAEYLNRLAVLEKNYAPAQFDTLKREALLANPEIDFGQILLVRRDEKYLALPQNWQGNSALKKNVNNEIATLNIRQPNPTLRDHLVSTLDFTPTLLEAAKLPPIPGIDGRSFLPAVKGEKMAGWDRVFTFYNAAFGNNWLPMCCLRTKEHAYIWNAWSDGQREYHTEGMSGLTWNTMLAAAATNAAIKARTDFYLHRVPEEFYDLTNDRCERTNLIGDPAQQVEIEAMRTELLALMRRTGDPFTEAFAHRDDKALASAMLTKLKREFSQVSKPNDEAEK